MHTRWVPDRVPTIAHCRARRPTPRRGRSSIGDGVAHGPRRRPSPHRRSRRTRVNTGTARREPYGPEAAGQRHPPARPLQATERSCRPLDRQQRRTPTRARRDAPHTKRSRLVAHRPPRPSGRPADSPSQLVGDRFPGRFPRQDLRLAGDHRQGPTLDLLRPGNLEPVVDRTGRASRLASNSAANSARSSSANARAWRRTSSVLIAMDQDYPNDRPRPKAPRCTQASRPLRTGLRRVPGPRDALPTSAEPGR